MHFFPLKLFRPLGKFQSSQYVHYKQKVKSRQPVPNPSMAHESGCEYDSRSEM